MLDVPRDHQFLIGLKRFDGHGAGGGRYDSITIRIALGVDMDSQVP
jgi:hypothetical protein